MSRRRVLTDDQIREARTMRRAGKTIARIAKQFGVGSTTIHYWCGNIQPNGEPNEKNPRYKTMTQPAESTLELRNELREYLASVSTKNTTYKAVVQKLTSMRLRHQDDRARDNWSKELRGALAAMNIRKDQRDRLIDEVRRG